MGCDQVYWAGHVEVACAGSLPWLHWVCKTHDGETRAVVTRTCVRCHPASRRMGLDAVTVPVRCAQSVADTVSGGGCQRVEGVSEEVQVFYDDGIVVKYCHLTREAKANGR